VNALLIAFIVSTTAVLSVVLGVFGAYYTVNFVLSAINPVRPAPAFRSFVPQHSRMSGD
jgi:hypothetical protein